MAEWTECDGCAASPQLGEIISGRPVANFVNPILGG